MIRLNVLLGCSAVRAVIASVCQGKRAGIVNTQFNYSQLLRIPIV